MLRIFQELFAIFGKSSLRSRTNIGGDNKSFVLKICSDNLLIISLVLLIMLRISKIRKDQKKSKTFLKEKFKQVEK